MLMWMLCWCQMGALLAYRVGQQGEAGLVASLPVQARLPPALLHAHLQWPAAEHIYTYPCPATAREYQTACHERTLSPDMTTMAQQYAGEHTWQRLALGYSLPGTAP